jgi:hypothetical protein
MNSVSIFIFSPTLLTYFWGQLVSQLVLIVDMASYHHDIAASFVGYYYNTFDTNRAALSQLYVCSHSFTPSLFNITSLARNLCC